MYDMTRVHACSDHASIDVGASVRCAASARLAARTWRLRIAP